MTHAPDFSRSKVLIAGDVMLDRYWLGDTSRISPEAPVPVVHVTGSEDRPGGAANVALNCAALGARASLSGIVGEDEAAQTLRNALNAAGIAHGALVSQASVPTITKLRVLSRNQQLIRLDFEEAPSAAAEAVAEAVTDGLPGVGVLVLSDYAKGALAAAPALIAAARERGVAIVVDPKGADFSRYRGASMLTPNRSEFEAVVGVCDGDEQIVTRGTALLKDLGLEALLVTRSAEGITLIQRGAPPLHLPTVAREVFDVTGAGDTVVAVLATARAAGESWEDAARLANVAAGVVVGKLGTATVTRAELEAALHPVRAGAGGVMPEAGLLEAVATARANGQRIVMTNGCFDLLHPGHLAYLHAARELGDLLIVAVNDDDSVRRLKGAERPLNRVEDRMDMLAALRSVDHVVAFGEDTPERLICAVKPDVLVKGGDYRPDQVAGGDCAGDVRILEFLDGYSTTGLVDRIRTGAAPAES